MKIFVVVLLFAGFATQFASAQGVIGYGNHIPGSGIDAPVFDVDCQTRLEGRSYLAQVYVGVTPENLLAAGPILPFGLGAGSGYVAQHSATIPGVVNALVYTQLRAMEAAAGPTYEAAVSAGGKHGFSNIVPMLALAGPPTPQDPVGLQSFCLIPEPPTWALGLLGALGSWITLAWRRSRMRGGPV